FLSDRWQQLGATLLAGLRRFHQEQPDELGPDRDRLRRYALPQLERAVFLARLEACLTAGELAASGPWLHAPEHRVRLGAEEGAGGGAQGSPLAAAGGGRLRPALGA